MRLFPIIALGAIGLTGASATGDDRPIVIAHRGASGYLPEHTQEAVVLAHAQEADYIEQDLVLTKDGELVVLHDVQIDTVTNVADRFPDRKRSDGRWYAIDFTLAELKDLNVHERIDHKTGKPAFEGRRFPSDRGSFRIPTFEEEIDLIEGLNQTTGRQAGIYPEIKSPAWHRKQGADISSAVLKVLEKRGYNDKAARCFVQCFEWPEIQRLRDELGYKGRLIYLFGSRPLNGDPDPTTAAGLSKIAPYVDGLGPSLAFVEPSSQPGRPGGPAFVDLAHQHKLAVHAWTVRSDARADVKPTIEELYRPLFDVSRVDGLFSDHPDQAVRYRDQRNSEDGK